MNDIFWNAYPWLLWIHDYAKSMRFNPYGLLTALLTRYSALLPPNVVLQVTDNDLPMSLNLDAVLVGTAGTGKGRQLAAARRLIPSNDSPVPFKEIKPKSGEGVVSKFAEMRPATDENGKPVERPILTAGAGRPAGNRTRGSHIPGRGRRHGRQYLAVAAAGSVQQRGDRR